MKIETNFNLINNNTFNINVKCNNFITVESKEDLLKLYSDESFNQKHLILGGGSNVLFKTDFDGNIISPNILGLEINKLNNEQSLVKANCGETWHNLVNYCVENGLSGIENLALIPGLVGAAPIQNIGAYGIEQDMIFYELEVFDKTTGEFETFKKEDCEFGYRDSVFKHLKAQNNDIYIITSVTYILNNNPNPNLTYQELATYLETRNLEANVKNIFDAVCEIRSSKLPDIKIEGNAGSFFKNPVVSAELAEKVKSIDPINKLFPQANGMVKLSAARLIEFCDLKGHRIGDAGVSAQHSLVLVNYGKATGNEIYQISETVINKVYDTFGIKLEREVNIV